MSAECGTVAGCHRHYRNGERPCEPCAQARRDYERDRRRRNPGARAAEYARRDDRRRQAGAAALIVLPAVTKALPCAAAPDDWFPERDDHRAIAAAKAACRTCPALTRCLEWVTEHPQEHGVWAGLSESERRGLKRRVAA